MDAERRERLAQQIGQVRDFDQLFVISHDDTFEQSVDHVVSVTRETSVKRRERFGGRHSDWRGLRLHVF